MFSLFSWSIIEKFPVISSIFLLRNFVSLFLSKMEFTLFYILYILLLIGSFTLVKWKLIGGKLIVVKCWNLDKHENTLIIQNFSLFFGFFVIFYTFHCSDPTGSNPPKNKSIRKFIKKRPKLIIFQTGLNFDLFGTQK